MRGQETSAQQRSTQIGFSRRRSTMPGDEAVTYWLRQLEAGDEEAARRLWQRYYRELVELARARLGTTPRRVVDEEDVALSVMRCPGSKFERTSGGSLGSAGM